MTAALEVLLFTIIVSILIRKLDDWLGEYHICHPQETGPIDQLARILMPPLNFIYGVPYARFIAPFAISILIFMIWA